ncbi:MAG: hypothetical protein IT330_10680 [Anaerolineae bacterium]|nr:hypothetical protein [Anaerolineae bacterium]
MRCPTETESTTVECYSGHTYAQEPRTFVWEGARLLVSAVERAWRTPSGRAFRVITPDGRRFRLLYDEATDAWACLLLSDAL